MALFTIADLHLSFKSGKPMDIFGSAWRDHDKKLKEYWEYMVSDSDTVVVPGDISWAMSLEDAVPDLEFIEHLPGKKILMKGNHDYWWNSLKKLEDICRDKGFKTISFLQNGAFFADGKVICGSRGWAVEDAMTPHDRKILEREAERFRLSLEKAKVIAEEKALGQNTPEIIGFSHYPVVTASQIKNPVLDVLSEYGIKRVYYGHLHNQGAKPLFDRAEGIEFILVSSDYRMFTPVRIE